MINKLNIIYLLSAYVPIRLNKLVGIILITVMTNHQNKEHKPLIFFLSIAGQFFF